MHNTEGGKRVSAAVASTGRAVADTGKVMAGGIGAAKVSFITSICSDKKVTQCTLHVRKFPFTCIQIYKTVTPGGPGKIILTDEYLFYSGCTLSLVGWVET